MHRISIFIRLSDWPIERYQEQLKILSEKAFGIESIYITNEGMTSFSGHKTQALLNLFNYAPKTEITLEIQPSLAKNIPEEINRLSLMDCQKYSEKQITPLLLLKENTNIDWDFSDKFNITELERFVTLQAPHKAAYGIDDINEFSQIAQKLREKSYMAYDDFHFCLEGYQCKYLQITNSAHGQWLGIGPNAQSHIL